MSVLIFDSRRGRFGTQKSRQFGLLSDVKLAMRRNAELPITKGGWGVDGKSLSLVIPFWEGAGAPRDIGSSNSASSVGTYNYTNKGVDLQSAALKFGVNQPAAAMTSLSIVAGMNLPSIGADRNRGIFDAKNNNTAYYTTSDGYLLWYLADGGITFRVGASDAYTTTNYLEGTGDKQLTCVWDAGTTQDVFVDGQKISYTFHSIASSYDAIADAEYIVGNYYDGWTSAIRRFDGEMFYFYLLENWCLNDSQVQQIWEAPYLLLQPNPAPVCFDFGAADTQLSLNDTTHAHSADNLTLSQIHTLALAEADHAHQADNISILQQHVLSLSDADHAHSADNLTLLQQQLLTILDAAHDQTADTLALSQIHSLSVADTLHAHTADNITLLLGSLILAVKSATHAHSADKLTLQQAHQLTIAEALHGHSADDISLDLALMLSIADAMHAHGADSISLTQQHLLSADDALHSMLADNLALLQDHNLSLADALHAHNADSITLFITGQGLGIISDTTIINLTPQRGVLNLTVKRTIKQV